MFYQETPDATFRFGDVLFGYPFASSLIKGPVIDGISETNLTVQFPKFLAVLTPCCTIRHGRLSLAPLIPIRPSFLRNEFWAEDLTRINREMDPKDKIPAAAWEAKSEAQKREWLEPGPGYVLEGLFVYERSEKLPKYVLERREGNIEQDTYMIDFGQVHQVHCESVTSGGVPLESKVLQLTIETRDDLRKKIVEYYGRIPDEDVE